MSPWIRCKKELPDDKSKCYLGYNENTKFYGKCCFEKNETGLIFYYLEPNGMFIEKATHWYKNFKLPKK